jgi:hypothetical protein
METFTTVILIDLDGTIIGDISPQIMSFELSKGLKSLCSKYTFDLVDFRDKLSKGIIRPGFDTFIKTIKQHFGNVEFFIYTASEKSWAEFIIKQIETVIGFKFNRPIFSRDHCMQNDSREYRKSTSYIKKQLQRCLHKKYNKHSAVQSILIIDNNNVYSHNDQKHILLCPSYNYRIPENIVLGIKQKCYEEHYHKIHNVLKRYIQTSFTPSKDFILFQREFYTYYVYYLNAIVKSNGKYAKDTFWTLLKNLIVTENIRVFNESNVRLLNKYVRKEQLSA